MPFLNDQERQARKDALKKNMRVNRLEEEEPDDFFEYAEYDNDEPQSEGYSDDVDEAEVEKLESRIRDKTRHTKQRIAVIAAAVVVVLAVIAVVWLLLGWRSISTKWTLDVPASDSVAYESLGSGLLRYSRDGAGYYSSSGEEEWNQAFDMTSPMTACSDKYVVIADAAGTGIYIFDETGLTGSAESQREITKVTISDNGYVAVVSDDGEASYINYYNASGEQLSIEVKTAIVGEGFPVDASLSSDGSILMVSYTYLDGGAISNRVVFYNFSEEGEATAQRIVGGFEQYEGAIAADVEMFDDTHAVAIAEDRISFYSLSNRLSPKLSNEIEMSEKILSIAISDSRVAIVQASSENNGAYTVSIYNSGGSLVKSFTTEFAYTNMSWAGNYLVLSNSESCEVYTSSGTQKFSGAADGGVSHIYYANGNWFMAGTNTISRFSFSAI